MGTLSERIITPVGRFVSGSLTEKRTTDYEGRIKPEDKQQYEFGFAIRKDDAEINACLGAVHAHATTEFSAHPQISAIIGQFDFGVRGFSWKIADGSKPDQKGNVNKNTVDCWVIYFKTSWAIPCVDASNATIPAEDFKRGFFGVVAFKVQGNDLFNDHAGIYMNPEILKMVAHGNEITGSVDAETAFKDHVVPATLPPGASLTPVATPLPSPGAPVAGQMPDVMPPSPSGATLPETASPSSMPHPNFADGPKSS